MASIEFKNNARSTVSGTLAVAATTLNVAAGEGANFPSSFPFKLTIFDDSSYPDAGLEIVKCTARTTDALTIIRAQEGTADVGHIEGERVAMLLTAGHFNDVTTGIVTRLDTIETFIDQSVISGASPTFDGVNITNVDADTLIVDVKEANISAVKKGQICAIVGSSGAKFEVQLCDCDDASLIRVLGLVAADTAQNGVGKVVYKGLLTNVNSQIGNTDVNPNGETWLAGDLLFASTTAGGLTNVRPSSGRCIKAGRTLKGNSASDTFLAIVSTNSICACAAAGEDICSRMGDNDGVNKHSFKDYADNEIAAIDSNGNLTLIGNIDTPTGRCATFVVAANDSRALSKHQADYVCDGTADEVQIQAAIDALPASGGKIILMEGVYTKSTGSGISMPSNTEIELLSGSSISFNNSINADGCIFTNSDRTNGNTNITICGKGVLCGNDVNQSSGVQFGVDFKYVDGIVDIRIEEFVNADVRFIDCNIDYKNRNYTKSDILISDCESLTGWSTPSCGTLELSTDRRAGNKSFKFITTEANPCYVLSKKTWANPIDMRFMDVSFWMKFNDISLADSSCRIRLYTTPACNDNDYARFGSAVFGGEMEDDKWHHMRQSFAGGLIYVNGSTTDSYESLSHVYGVRITIINANLGVMNVWIDDIRMVSAPMEPIFNLSFDNPTMDTVDIIATQMAKHGYVGSIHPDNLDSTYNSIAEILYKQFMWEICPHINAQSTKTDSEFYQHMVNLKSRMDAHGLSRGTKFASFEGHVLTGERTQQVKQIYSGWRSTSTTFTTAWFDKPSKYIDIRYDFNATVKPLIDACLKHHATLYLVGHYIGDGSGISITESELNTVLDYLHDTIGVKMATFNEIFNTDNAILDERPKTNPTHSVSDILMDVLAVSAIHVRSNEDLSAATPITFTLDAQPDVPRTLSWAFDTHAQITEHDMEVIGIDAKGNTVTETWDETAGWSGETNNAFAVITSIKMTSRTGTGAGDTMDIGITDVLGLSNVIYEISDIFKIKKNNANVTVATAQVNTIYDTYDMSVIGLAVTDDFTIWYKSNLNIIS